MRTALRTFTAFLILGCSYAQFDDIFNPDMGTNQEESEVVCGVGKICIQPGLCVNGKINQYGVNLITERSGFSQCKTTEVCCELPEDGKPIRPAKITLPSCGVRKIGGIGHNQRSRYRTDFGEFPWVLRLTGARSKYYGGGSLIHPQIALTAAHIIANVSANQLTVFAGEWHIDSDSEPLPHQVRSVTEIVRHERHDRRRLYYDIALLFLAAPFDLAEHIGTICLPPPNFVPEGRCYATGWGKDQTNSKFSSYLKRVDLPIEPNPSCQQALRQTALTFYFILNDSFLCAGGEVDTDVCFGDGGSPLVCPIAGKNSEYHQVGIVSWGLECGREDIPGVYASLPYLRQWVDQQVTQRHFDTSFYTN